LTVWEEYAGIRGVQKNRITEKTEKTDGKLTEKTEPR